MSKRRVNKRSLTENDITTTGINIFFFFSVLCYQSNNKNNVEELCNKN